MGSVELLFDFATIAGFGKVYRNCLRRKWGVCDRNDVINAGKFLISQKLADPRQLCILGRSAGGFLIQAAVLKTNMFAAVASYYGVSDLVGLVKVCLRKNLFKSFINSCSQLTLCRTGIFSRFLKYKHIPQRLMNISNLTPVFGCARSECARWTSNNAMSQPFSFMLSKNELGKSHRRWMLVCKRCWLFGEVVNRRI